MEAENADSESQLVDETMAGASPADRRPIVSTPQRRPTSSSIIPTPVQNEIARVLDVESADPHFDCHFTDANGVSYNKYKTLEPLVIPVPTQEVLSILSVEDSGPVWNAVVPVAYLSDWFRTKISRVLPAHVALVFDQRFSHDFERADKRGRARSTGPFLIGYRGYCPAKKDGCPMTFIIGF